MGGLPDSAFDPLREPDVLRESQLLDVRVEPLISAAGLVVRAVLGRVVSMREEQGVVEFQLYLLKVMQPPEEKLAAVLEGLQRTGEDLDRASEKVSMVLHPRLREPRPVPAMSGDVAEMLRGAAVPGPREYAGEGQWYRFSVWPEFAFHMTFEDSVGFLGVADFVRWPSGGEENAEPEVWRFLESDLTARFAEIKEVDVWGHYQSYVGRSLTDGHEYFLRFGCALLQEITRLDADRAEG